MKSKKAIKVKVEYEDGSWLETDFSRVSAAGRRELEALGLLPREAMKEEDKERYVLLEWKEGWKEVYAVPADVVRMRKYYVIRRVEEVGRLFLDRTEGYPEMIEVLRKPKEIERVTLTETYELRQKGEKKLGDKQEIFYELEPTVDRAEQLRQEVEAWLSKEGKTARDILKASDGGFEDLEKIRKALRLTAGLKQGDAMGFVRSLLRGLEERG